MDESELIKDLQVEIEMLKWQLAECQKLLPLNHYLATLPFNTQRFLKMSLDTKKVVGVFAGLVELEMVTVEDKQSLIDDLKSYVLVLEDLDERIKRYG